MNLVENAVRYSPRPGRVALRASPGAGHTVVLEVDDEGPGIPGERREPHGSHMVVTLPQARG